jgi:hypothetical protein
VAHLELDRRGYWGADGRPTALAADFAKWGQSGHHLSAGEMALLRAALAFWNGHEGASVADVLGQLDAPLVYAVASLMVAASLSPEAVEAWIVGEEWRDALVEEMAKKRG